MESDAQGFLSANSNLALTPHTSDGFWWTNGQVASAPYQDLMGKQYKIGLGQEGNRIKNGFEGGT